MIWRIVRGIWVSVGLAMALLAIVLLPIDFAETDDALKIWQALWPFRRETTILLLSAACIIYAFWRDFEESVLPMFAHRIGIWKDKDISVVEMARMAKNSYSWKIFDRDSLDVLDFIDGVGHAVATGKIDAFGLHNPENYSNLRIIYPRSIPVEHWNEHSFEGFSAIYIGDNLQAISKPRHVKLPIKVFMDIRLDRAQARKWLQREGGKWKGTQDAKRRQEASKISDSLVAAAND